MTNGKFEITFLGTNGSCAYGSSQRVKYGCNTPCIAVKAGDETLIFDAGSGICGFSSLNGYQTEHLSIFFSHYHIDHISGLLFLPAFFDYEKTIDLYGGVDEKSDFYDIIDDFLSPPLHPVSIQAFNAKCRFHTLGVGERVLLPGGVAVRTYMLSHPGGSMGYRVEYGGKVFCYCTDVELSKHKNDVELLKFLGNADLLVLDAFFEDGKVIPGWGHSSWREAADWTKRAGAKKLALFHYGFMALDSDIDIIEEKAKENFQNTFASADRMQVEL